MCNLSESLSECLLYRTVQSQCVVDCHVSSQYPPPPPPPEAQISVSFLRSGVEIRKIEETVNSVSDNTNPETRRLC